MLTRTLGLVFLLAGLLVLAACAAPKGEPELAAAPVAAANVHADCTKCHYSSSPTAANPGLRSQSQVLVSTDPGIVVLGEISDLYEPVRFDHKAHAEMANIDGGCTTCHHQTPVVGEKPACKECHLANTSGESPLQPSLQGAYHQQCLTCHNKLTQGSNNCNSCHEPKNALSSNLAGKDSAALIIPTEPENPPTVVFQTSYNNTIVSFSHLKHSTQLSVACARCHNKQDDCGICHTPTGQPAQPVGYQKPLHDVCLPCHSQMQCNDCHKPKAS